MSIRLPDVGLASNNEEHDSLQKQTTDMINTKEKMEIEWHPAFNDPKADVVLVASDGIHFRLSSWYMSRKSGFIKDLIEMTTPTSKELSESGIETNCSSGVLVEFAQLVYSADNRIKANYSFSMLLSLFDLCQHLQCDDLLEALLSAIESRVDIDPWRVFEFAATQNDIALARAAITHFDKFPFLLPNNITLLIQESANGLPNRFLSGLLRLKIGNKFVTYQEGMGGPLEFLHLPPWNKVAKAFFWGMEPRTRRRFAKRGRNDVIQLN